MPGVVVHGTAVIEWLEGERFITHRARTDHPNFPDSLSVIGRLWPKSRDRLELTAVKNLKRAQRLSIPSASEGILSSILIVR